MGSITLSGDRNVRRAVYGSGPDATTIVVNFGATDAEVTVEQGGRTVLPPWGFVVEGPCFVAFHAKRWNSTDYGQGAMFTLQGPDGKPLKESACVRVFHAFGPATLSWQGQTHEVPREELIEQRAQ